MGIKGQIPWNKGKKMSNAHVPRNKEWRERMSKSMKGKHTGKHHSIKTEFTKGMTPWNKGKKLSGKHKEALSKSHKGYIMPKEQKEKIRLSHLGEKSHLWKGGITPINITLRSRAEYRLWRESVFQRDNWTCIWCGQRGGKLNADHIKPFALFPELRFAIDNGRTLCEECHKKTDTFAGRALKKYKKEGKK
jgi:hypothetical protein